MSGRVTEQMVRDAADRLLDEGVGKETITAILLPFAGHAIGPDLLRSLVMVQWRAWLTNAEHRMQNYAADESWARLRLLLAVYERVVR